MDMGGKNRGKNSVTFGNREASRRGGDEQKDEIKGLSGGE